MCDASSYVSRRNFSIVHASGGDSTGGAGGSGGALHARGVSCAPTCTGSSGKRCPPVCRQWFQPAPKQPGTPRPPRWSNYQYGAYSPLPQKPPGMGARHPGPPLGPPVHWAVGPCFACGEMGHLRTYCLRMQAKEMK